MSDLSRACLEAAQRIAEHICDTAHESNGRVAWMSTTQLMDEDGGVSIAYEAMEPNLYGGNGGVALFLAEMYNKTKEPRFRTLALGATRRALDNVRQRPSRIGLYDGWTGIVNAAARVAQLCDDGQMLDRARGAATACAARLPSKTGFDVVSGAAGAAPAMLVIARTLNEPRLTDVARRLGQRLLEAATRGPLGWSWGPASEPSVPHLTGFAHGAAGVSWCLGELYAAFGDPAFLEAALHAVDYEDSWYRDAEQNWVDLRDYAPDSGALVFGMGWCAGAPGIGLSRIRLMQHSTDDRLRRDAMRATTSCKRALRAIRPARAFDYSLCHGRLGICELLRKASQTFADSEASEIANATVKDGIACYDTRPADWPRGVVRGLNPSLLLGTAGIGHSLLRMAFDDVPSVLLIGA